MGCEESKTFKPATYEVVDLKEFKYDNGCGIPEYRYVRGESSIIIWPKKNLKLNFIIYQGGGVILVSASNVEWNVPLDVFYEEDECAFKGVIFRTEHGDLIL